MAGSLNKVMLIGHLGKDPELRYTQPGTPVANFNVATSEKFKGQDGQWQEKTEWHRVIAFGKTGEAIAQYLAKGSPVFVEGKLQTRKWTANNGQDRFTTEIVALHVQFLGSKTQGQQGPSQGQQRGYGQQGYTQEDDLGPQFPSEANGMDEVPF